MSSTEAAATTGCDVAMVSNALAALRADERAAQLGLPTAFSATPIQTRERLGTIEDDALFAETVRVVLDVKAGGNAVSGLVNRLRNAEDSDDAFDRLDAFYVARSTDPTGHRKRSDLTALMESVFAILDVDPEGAAGLVPSGDEEIWRDRLKRAARQLMAVDNALIRRAREAA